MRRALGGFVVAVALLGGVSACGSDEPEISADAAQVLGADVDAITAAARAKDAGKVQESLKALRTHVDQQQASGDLSPERASRILAAGARVALDVGAPAPEVVVSRVPAPPAPRQVPAEDDDKKGKGKGDGEKGESEDDD